MIEKGMHFQLSASLASGEINAGIVGNDRLSSISGASRCRTSRRLIHDAEGERSAHYRRYACVARPARGLRRAAARARALTLGAIRNFGRQARREPPASMLRRPPSDTSRHCAAATRRDGRRMFGMSEWMIWGIALLVAVSDPRRRPRRGGRGPGRRPRASRPTRRR